MKLTSAKTVEGSTVKIDTREGVKINDAKVIKTDVEASNGVIQRIGKVIMPGKKKESHFGRVAELAEEGAKKGGNTRSQLAGNFVKSGKSPHSLS